MDYWITKLLYILPMLLSGYCQDVFNTMPPPVNTNFTCRNRDTGFYADVETNCRAYHTCDDHGNKFTYYCPEETAFRQEALVCDHAHLVDCAKGRRVSTFTEENGNKNTENGRSMDVFNRGNSNAAYTRSFRITPEPQSESQFSGSKFTKGKQQPTFVLNSSVFLRDRVRLQKSSSTSQNDPAATESWMNLEKNNKKEKEHSTGGLSAEFSSTISTTTDLPSRYFGKKEETNEFFRKFSFPTATSSTTFRPFGADHRLNSGITMDSEFSRFIKNAEKEEFFGRSSTTNSNPTPLAFKFRNSDKKDESIDRFSSMRLTTTYRPFITDTKIQGSSGDHASFGKVKFNKGDGISSSSRIESGDNNPKETRKDYTFSDDRKNKEKSDFGRSLFFERRNGGEDNVFRNSQDLTQNNGRSPFFFDNSNYPYSETLRSMQAKTDDTVQPYSSKTFTKKITSVTTPRTEFPVVPFTGLLSPLIPNELEDDPYYPKRSTTTEAYYKLSDRDKKNKIPFRFSTTRPWTKSLDFELPEVLPDFNTLDDLVDRRKLFFIPRVRAA